MILQRSKASCGRSKAETSVEPRDNAEQEDLVVIRGACKYINIYTCLGLGFTLGFRV